MSKEERVGNFETDQQPNLMAELGDQEFLFGDEITTLNKLKEECPLDENDPRMTREAENTFVVKVAAVTNLEIKPSHVNYFSRVAEKQGLGAIFTVANRPQMGGKAEEPDKTNDRKAVREAHMNAAINHETGSPDDTLVRATQPDRSAEETPPTEEVPVFEDEPQPVELEAVAEFMDESGEDLEVIALPMEHDVAVFLRPTTAQQEAARFSLTADDATEKLSTRPMVNSANTAKARVPEEDIRLIDRHDPAAIELRNPHHILELIEDAPKVVESVSHSTLSPQSEAPRASEDKPRAVVTAAELIEARQTAIDLLAIPEQDDPADTNIAEVSVVEETNSGTLTNEMADQPVAPPDSWSRELAKEPEALLETFMEALRVHSAEADDTHEHNRPETFAALIAPSHEAERAEPVPLIIKTVAEQLVKLSPEKKEMVAPVVKSIVGTVHGIKILEAKQADSEQIEALESQLEELCISFFEALDIDYGEEEVAQFIQAIRSPDFTPYKTPKQQVRQADLTKEGTREAKYSAHLNDDLLELSARLQQILGMFTLFYARLQHSGSGAIIFSEPI